MDRKTPWTPGPWAFDAYEGEDRINLFKVRGPKAKDFPTLVCSVWSSEGDARLIAAAPDMYDCLAENLGAANRILADLPYHEAADDLRATLNAMRDDIIAILTKARGEDQ